MTLRSIKRTSGEYDVYSDNVTIHGNLVVTGTTTTITTQELTVEDPVITLNKGETGSSIASGFAGIEIDRGSGTTPSLGYKESLGTWALSDDGITYLPLSSGVTLAGNDTEVIYNQGGITFGANSNFTYDYTNNYITVSNITIQDANISTINSNQDLQLNANGTGVIAVGPPIMMQYQGSDPSAIASNTHVYANTPAGGATGVYFVNTAKSGELVSKKRAKFFAWIF